MKYNCSSAKTLPFLFFFSLVMSNLKADVVYATPLKGQEHQIGNLLHWATSTEFNSQAFIVEKSMDGVDFEGVGEIEAAGDSDNENGYRFLDVGVNDERSYYRLRQIDTDGTASYSQTIMVKKVLENEFMVLAMSRTTTNDKFTIAVDALIDDEISYSVKNENRELVFTDKQPLFYGINEIMINVGDEPEGTYFITLKVKNEKESLIIRKVDDEIKKKENVASRGQNNSG